MFDVKTISKLECFRDRVDVKQLLHDSSLLISQRYSKHRQVVLSQSPDSADLHVISQTRTSRYTRTTRSSQDRACQCRASWMTVSGRPDVHASHRVVFAVRAGTWFTENSIVDF